MIAWLYLLAGERVGVHRARNSRWQHFGNFSVIDLKSLDVADLRTRQEAVDG